MNMKRILSLLLCLSLFTTFFGCQADKTDEVPQESEAERVEISVSELSEYVIIYSSDDAGESLNNAVKDLADTINGYAQLIVWTDNGYSSMEDISDAIEEFQGFLPGLSADLGQLTLGKVDKNDIGGSLMGPSKSYLNKYILFRILWSIIFCAIAIVAMIVLSDGGGTSNYRRSHIRTERVSSRRSSDGRRPSRRTRRY